MPPPVADAIALNIKRADLRLIRTLPGSSKRIILLAVPMSPAVGKIL
jgi:hypothetical protein